MKITVNYNCMEGNSLPKVVNAEYINDYILDIQFSNGEIKRVNFGKFLKESLHPSIKKYLDKDKFNQFTIKNGNVNWNNYDLIFPIEDLLYQRI
jgi:hypothetical protein